MLTYYAFDVIEDKKGSFNLIDIHGFSDALSFTEKAHYSPRFERMYRFQQIVKGFVGDKKVIYFFPKNNDDLSNFPASVKEFYDGLPDGAARLGWLSHDLRPSGVFKTELKYQLKAAKHEGVDMLITDLICIRDDIEISSMDIKNMRRSHLRLSYDEVGLVLKRSQVPFLNPWYQGIVTVNPPTLDYLLDVWQPKWLLREFFDDMPNEGYIGMGMQCDLSGRLIFKPLCGHSGRGVSMQKPVQSPKIHLEIPDFPYTEEDKEKKAAKWHFNDWPAVEMGITIVQEYIEPKIAPMRVQIFGGQLISAMYRMCDGQPFDRNTKTYWQRADDDMEKRVMEWIMPKIARVEERTCKMTASDIEKLRLRILKEKIG